MHVQQATDAAEDSAIAWERVCEKSVSMPRVDLTDRLTYDLQGQTVAAVAVHQALPTVRVALDMFVGEQCPSFGHTKAVQLQCTCVGKKCQLRWSLAAGEHQAAPVRRFADGLQ